MTKSVTNFGRLDHSVSDQVREQVAGVSRQSDASGHSKAI